MREYLKEHTLISDGAFGTYFSTLCQGGMFPERANTEAPELVRQVHKAYLDAGAKLIRTNTFASNTKTLGCDMAAVLENVKQGFWLAKEAAGDRAFIAGDIGPITPGVYEDEEQLRKEYLALARQFVSLGADAILFETFSDTDMVLSVARELRRESDIFIWVQFSVNQLGYSNAGISAKTLLSEAAAGGDIDATGLNCGVGPGHMAQILSKLELTENVFFSALPNASYPKIIQDRIVFLENMDYFAQKLSDIRAKGISIVGGCCGTNPDYIRKVANLIEEEEKSGEMKMRRVSRTAYQKTVAGKEKSPKEASWPAAGQWFQKDKKLIAVELSPPPTAQDEKLMDAAHLLKRFNVDVITFPDSPSGRTRADSILMAAKAFRETGLCVMPHICCRDKNAIGIRSQLLGAYLSDIRNLLIVTGDPVPTMVRADIKGVFNFDSVGLMKLVKEMNKESFTEGGIHYGGAINQNRLNSEVEIGRIRKKMEQGAEFFLTQPVFTPEEAEILRRMKAETGAKILCGIMPLVSYKNACFIKNEMTGMRVTDEIVLRYQDAKTREEGEAVGISLAKEIMRITEDFADGYYYSIPFNRVYMLEEILTDLS
nr:bifunctional homocysteine S-methyltransferase/methylenetetrahydrofolate reductase [Lachnospiraceae bacterium]